MKKEDIEILSFDDLEEEEFMLNDKTPKKEEKPQIVEEIIEEVVKEDTVIDTKEEKDLYDRIEEAENEILKNKPAPVEEKEEPKKKEKVKKEKVPKEKKVKEKKVKEKKTKEKKETSKKLFWSQVVFCILSAIFIITCFVHYGSRMIKYYKIYNPKTETGETAVLLGNSITTSSSIETTGSGLYRVSGAYIYKGTDVDNYVLFNNNLWRITKINTDGSIEMITDNYVNAMNWNNKISTYKDSDVRKYLNNVFLNTLDKEYLTTLTFCEDKVNDITNMTCNDSNSEDYVRLLSINEFLNCMVDGKTFITSGEEYLWLYDSSDTAVWHTNGSNVSSSDANTGNLVKALVHVKNSTVLLGGKGTKEEPYIIEKENKKLNVGTYVKLGEDTWVIYDKKDDVLKLSLTNVLENTYRFATDKNEFNPASANSLANYLNNTYYNSLSYKDMLLDSEWYIGNYNNSYEDVTSKKVTSKVGLLSVADLKYDEDISKFYFLLTPGETYYTYISGEVLRESKITFSRYIRPTISIKETNIKEGKGTRVSPYVLEVK